LESTFWVFSTDALGRYQEGTTVNSSQLREKEPEKCYTCRTRRNPPFHKEELYAFPIPL